MKQPIGFFDSGVGGLSLLPAVSAILPNEDICYLADETFSPYGDKTHKEILDRARAITLKLLSFDCKLIVLACNTATTQVINQLRKEFTVPFVGIEPAIKPAALTTQTGVVGVLATKGTLNSQLFHKSSLEHGSKIQLVEQIGTGLVACVESNKIDDPSTFTLLESFLNPMVDRGMDSLVLGCTHYPFLIPVIKKIIPQHVRIIDNSQAVAQQIKRRLTELDLCDTSNTTSLHTYFSSSSKSNLSRFVKHTINFLPL
jgi:glutamate racemase